MRKIIITCTCILNSKLRSQVHPQHMYILLEEIFRHSFIVSSKHHCGSVWIHLFHCTQVFFSCFRSHQGRLINRCLLKKTVCSHIQIFHSHGPDSAARFIGSATNTESSCLGGRQSRWLHQFQHCKSV